VRQRLITAVLLVAALVAAGCDTTTGKPVTNLTMAELIEKSIGGDGTMNLQTTMMAFAHQFGALPGVTLPAVMPDPPGLRMSGSTTIRAMANHWPELSVEQRQAFLKVVTPPPGEPPRLRAQPPSVQDKARRMIRSEVDDLVKEISRRVGVTIPAVEFSFWDEEVPGVRAWTLPLATGEFILPGTRDKIFPLNGKTKQCLMFFPPSIWNHVDGGVASNQRTTIAHELVHCFQAFTYPDLSQYRAAPGWLQDGFAEFAGIVLAGSSHVAPPNNWSLYLTTDMRMIQRTYSAIGWWFQLEQAGQQPWRKVAQVWQSGQVGNDAYLTLGGASDAMYDTWAASRKRDAGFGDDWEVYGVDVPQDIKPKTFEWPAEEGKADVEAFDTRTGRLVTREGFEGILRVGAAQPIRIHDSAGFERVHITEGDYCLGPKCKCPENTERAGEEIRPIQGPLWLAVPGGESGNSVVSDVQSLEEYCKKKRKDRKKPQDHPQPSWAPIRAAASNPDAPRDAAPLKRPTAGSAGDPHLTMLDGHSFDFQAAGEFTLTKSDSDDLEIQVRQEPAINFDGSKSDTVTMNTAVAAKAGGERFTFYPGQDRPEVRAKDLARVTQIESGQVLRWPDGSELWVLTSAPGSLNVLFGPAGSRKGKLNGMLGPFDGSPGSTAMTDRDGERYEKPDADELYDDIGDSWRIEQEDSLFDYQPGQSTDTFTDEDLPAKRLTLADLTAGQRQAGEKACAGVTDALREQCVFDVAVSGNDKFAVGYRTLDKLTTVGGGDVTVGKPIGPDRLEPGQQKTFTIDSDADALYFATDADCTKPTSATVYWRVTAPDGSETLQVPMCADAGRRTTGKPGTWRIDVFVAPGADQGGVFALHAEQAGPLRTFQISLPKTVDNGSLRGAGGEDRYRFTAAAGDKVTLTAKSPCGSGRALYWGLESPDGNRITLRTRACENIGQQTIPAAGTWSVFVYNHTADEGPHAYAFSAR
jgi:hypothetical protein